MTRKTGNGICVHLKNTFWTMEITKKLVLQVFTGGSAGIAFLFIMLAMFGFTSKKYYHDDKIGVQFGMIFDLETQESRMWARVPGAICVRSTIYNIYKVEENGDKTPRDFSALMPIARAVHGNIDIKFEISRANETEFPDLEARNQVVVPMGYLSRNSTLISIFRYVLLMGAIVLNHWTFFNVMAAMYAVGTILLGILLRFRNRKKKRNFVTHIKEEMEPPRPSLYSRLKHFFSKYRATSGL